jgi:hypothetical protein
VTPPLDLTLARQPTTVKPLSGKGARAKPAHRRAAGSN